MERLLSFGMIALGVLGAWLRGLHLHSGYEAKTGLPIAGNLYWYALVALSVAFALCCLLYMRKAKYAKGASFERTFAVQGMAQPIVSAIAAAGLIFFGILGMQQTVTQWSGQAVYAAADRISVFSFLSSFVLWVLSVLSGAALYLMGRMQKRKQTTKAGVTLSAFPLFWACLSLVFFFRENSSNPVLSSYVLELFAIIFIMYSFYAYASFFFSVGSPGKFASFAAMSVYLILVSLGGRLMAFFLGEAVFFGGTRLALEGMMAFCFLFLAGNVFVVTRNSRQR